MYHRDHHRRSIRLSGYDYAQTGAYFVTICTAGKQPLFGRVANHRVRLNALGEIVKNEWLKTGMIRENFRLGEYVIMPDHFHAIVKITKKIDNNTPAIAGTADGVIDNDGVDIVGAAGRLPLPQHTTQPQRPQHAPPPYTQFRPRSLPSFVCGFKAAAAKRINILRGMPGTPIWQRNYYERIIRSDAQYARVTDYIRRNPIVHGSATD